MNVRKLTIGFAAVAALSASLYAATFSSVAGAGTASTVVRTWDCHTDPLNISTMVQVKAWPTGASVATGDPSAPEPFVSFSTHDNGYTVGSRCRPVARHVTMTTHGLVSSTMQTAFCASPAHVWIRLELVVDGNGRPASARIEVTQPHAKFKPLAHLDWTTSSSTVYHRPHSCTAQN